MCGEEMVCAISRNSADWIGSSWSQRCHDLGAKYSFLYVEIKIYKCVFMKESYRQILGDLIIQGGIQLTKCRYLQEILGL